MSCMQTFTWSPTSEPTGEEQFRVMTAQFGDGYKQTAGDGINNTAQSWPVQFVGSAAYITQIRDFLRAHGGVKPFFWTPPLGGRVCTMQRRSRYRPKGKTGTRCPPRSHRGLRHDS